MIALAGHVLVDVVARHLDEWPAPGTLAAVERIDLRLGGCVPNTGQVISRLGVPVAVIGRVGADELGRLVVRRVAKWAAWQLLTEDSRRSTSATVVIVGSDGERTFLHSSGANAGLDIEDIPLQELVSAGVRGIHIGYALLLERLDCQRLRLLLESAHAAGLLVSIDTTWARGLNWESFRDLLPLIDVFCPNLREAAAVTAINDPAAAAKELVRLGVRKVVAVKLGANGCLLFDEHGGARHIAGHHVDAVDATGAGDAFIGGMLASWHRGLDWDTAARIGNAAAAGVVTKLGGTEDALDWNQTVTLAGLSALASL